MRRSLRRAVCMMMQIALLLPLFACTQNTMTQTAADYAAITDFREIPGITQEEIEAIEAISANYTYFRYGVMESTGCFYAEDGSLQGFSILICENLSELFGIPFEPALLEWDALIKGLENFSYDFSSDIPLRQRTDNRYFMTDAIAERGMRLFVGNAAAYVSAQQSGTPLRYGYLERRTLSSELASLRNENDTVIPISNLSAANALLLSGELDVFVGAETDEAVLTAYSSMEEVSSLSYSAVSIATCNPELAPLISAIQKYIRADGGYALTQLKEESRYLYLREKFLAQLTPEERQYLAVHQNPSAVIPIGIEYDNYPLCVYNTQENAWQGIAVDILDEIEKLTGMYFGFANSRSDDWTAILRMLENGTVAMTTELIRTPEREGRFLWAEDPYLVDYYALLSRSEYPDLNISQIAGARVGLISNTAYSEVFEEIYPNHADVVYFNNKVDAFDALEKGEIDLLMLTRNLLLNAVNYLERTGIKENLIFDRPYESYFGFHKSQAILCSIISKAQSFLDVDQITDDWTRKVFDYRGKLARAQVPYLIGAAILLFVVLLLLGILLYKTRQMGKRLIITVEQRTEELRRRSEEL